MKQEAQFQSRLLKALRSHAALKDGVVLKLNADATTKGIPDVMISLRGVTTFFELKCEPNEATKIQVYYLRRLAPRAYVVKLMRSGWIRLHDFQNPLENVWDYTFYRAVDEIVRRCTDA